MSPVDFATAGHTGSQLTRKVIRAALTGALSLGASAVAPGNAHAVIGGEPATESYSFVTAVYMQGNDGKYQLCAGALIDRQWVLTAAHCVHDATTGETVDPSRFHLRIGSNDRTTGGVTAKAATIRVNPDFDAATNRAGDLALLKLDHPVKMKPVRMAWFPGVPGTSFRVTGWGVTAVDARVAPTSLNQLDTHVVADAQCVGGENDIDRGDFCADNPGNAAGPCYGDSGAPAVRKAYGRWELIGIDSRGVGDCAVTKEILPSVPYHRAWIDSVIHG